MLAELLDVLTAQCEETDKMAEEARAKVNRGNSGDAPCPLSVPWARYHRRSMPFDDSSLRRL